MTSFSRPLPTVDPAGYDRPTAAASAFPVAAWFAARGAAERLTLQPLKLQALLFLAQGTFAVRTGGRMLMPAVFVADERAPIEPNVQEVLANGWEPRSTPDATLAAAVQRFLDVVWERYGRQPAIDLVKLVSGLDAYRAAIDCGAGTPIGNDAIRRSCAGLEKATPADDPTAPKPLRTQDGRLVSVSAWTPAASAKSPR